MRPVTLLLTLVLCTLVLATGCPAKAGAAGGGAKAGAAATDPSGLPIISWEQAKEYEGKEAIVEGTVIATKQLASGITFINFHSDYKHTFSIFVSSGSKSAVEKVCSDFPACLEGKKIRAKGHIEHFTDSKGQDKPEMKVTSADQITIL